MTYNVFSGTLNPTQSINTLVISTTSLPQQLTHQPATHTHPVQLPFPIEGVFANYPLIPRHQW